MKMMLFCHIDSVIQLGAVLFNPQCCIKQQEKVSNGSKTDMNQPPNVQQNNKKGIIFS